MKRFIGKKVVVRAEGSGVHYGKLEEVKEKEVILSKARKLWYWNGACAVEEISVSGVTKPEDCKFTVTVKEIGINNWLQILPCTKTAIKSIEGVKVWKKG